MQDKNTKPGWRFIRTLLLTMVIVVVFAYGFQVTQINLEEPKKERRQEQLLNVLRSLARPDLTEYETERLEIEAPILVPCPATLFQLPDLTQPGPTIQLSARCAAPASEITVKGSGFEPGEAVFLYFVPYNADPSQAVELPLTNDTVNPDAQGNFVETVKLRRDRTSAEPQLVRAVVNRTSGWPEPSAAVYETVAKIIETIFLALIATTLGTILSIPISFLSARNLMIQVTSTFGSWLTLIVAAPLGWWAGWWLFSTVGGGAADLITGNGDSTAVILLGPALLFLTVQAAAGRSHQMEWLGILRGYGLGLLTIVAAALVLGILGGIGLRLGQGLEAVLGRFAFLGNFLVVAADTLIIFLPLIGGIVGAFALASLAGTLSENMLRRLGSGIGAKIFSIVMALLAGAILFDLVMAFVVWLYQLNNPAYYLGIAAAIGAIIFGLMAVVVSPDRPMPTGMIIYYASRTVLNTLRSIEPLIMAIVFVVWVGIGPFAGVLALTLHTIASLGKLYSEQVENIAEGPLEAVTATGANRLQTIIYAVMPQIVPPYIAFTIYRWDINVRMSTIIGFAGGGGIGFLLQQNLNLLKYRQASVQMIAIAIVVATLDYVSAKIREKIV
ncbi:MAG: ABC transporter permease subunit [Anaerolineae bacterium]|nr:ABC transporter permease subunit [Anaerolineae bacterium]